MMVWRGVLIRICDYRIPSAVRGTALFIIVLVPWTSTPGSDADVSFPVGEAADKCFEFRVFFDGADAFDFPVLVCEDGAAEIVFDVLWGFGPGGAEVLHEERIALSSSRMAFLLDCEVTACADNVGEVEEVIATEAVEGYFGLFALMAVVEGDYCARGFVWRRKSICGMRFDGDVEVMVPAMDFEGLRMARFIGDEDLGHFREYEA